MKSKRATFGVIDLIQESSIFIKGNNVLWRQETGALLLYDIKRDLLYKGNRYALIILSQCDGKNRVKDIAINIAQTWNIPYEQAVQDVQMFLSQLRGRDLIKQLK